MENEHVEKRAQREQIARELGKLAKLKLEAQTRDVIAGRKRIIVKP